MLSLTLGACGGWLASKIGMPLPWLLGATIANAVWVLSLPGKLNPVWAPPLFRNVFVAVIGVMIGGLFTVDLIATLPGWWPGIIALIIYCFVAQIGGYLIYRRIGGLDRATAFFSASPGGFVENIMLGERAGADVPILSMLQFLRIVLVVSIIPFGFLLWTGHAVGSAAGADFGGGGAGTAVDYLILAVAGAFGLALGLSLKIPAGQVIGPITASAIVHLTGLVEIQPPAVAGIVAQIVVGSSLGTRFAGASLKLLLRTSRLAILGVAWMLALAIIFAAVVHMITDRDPTLYVMSFAPAGVIEMSLIALTLGANPVFVTAHHIIRLFVTVVVTPMLYWRWLAKK
jgi:membrane AbrB-like protein